MSTETLVPKEFGKQIGSISPEIWRDEIARSLTPQESGLLERAQATLIGNIVTSDTWKPYRGIMPSITGYKGIWNWDSAFHAVAVSHWDVALAREQFEIIFNGQLPNGALPDVLWENGEVVTSCSKPPVMAWAIAVVDRRSPDIKFLEGIYPKLRKLGEFWLQERGGKEDGLFYYAGLDVGYDSGWDNSIRWDNGYRTSQGNDHRLWAIDLNCYMVTHYRAMAYIAERLQLPDDQKIWLEEAHALAKRINEKLWDETLGFYVDRDRLTGKNGPALSPAGFMPLFTHIASPERAARVAKLATDTQKFFPGMPTAPYDAPEFRETEMWRGPTWLNTAYFALKGLQEYGHAEAAESMRSTILGWVARDTSTISEYYNPKTGDGAGVKGFAWSSAFVIAFLLDWKNDHLTWLFPQRPENS